MGIDIEALRTEAERDGRDCVVTRRWLRQVLSEIEAARAEWDFVARLHPSRTSSDSHIVEVTELRPRGNSAP